MTSATLAPWLSLTSASRNLWMISSGLYVFFGISVSSIQFGTCHCAWTDLREAGQFWRLLYGAGLTPRLLEPAEDRELLRWGLGLTNLVARPTVGSSDLSRAELRAGVPRLREIVEAHQPGAVAYTGKGVYLAASGKGRAPWGAQEDSLFGPSDVVLPSPSGRVRLSFADKLGHYRTLSAWLAHPEEAR